MGLADTCQSEPCGDGGVCMLGSAGSIRAVLSMLYKAVTLMYSLQQHVEGERCARRRRHVYEEQGRKGDVTANHIRRCNDL